MGGTLKAKNTKNNYLGIVKKISEYQIKPFLTV